MTLSDLERQDAKSPVLRRIPYRKLVPFDQQRSNSSW